MPRAIVLAVVALALVAATPAHASRTVVLDAGDAIHLFAAGSDGALYHAPPGGVLARLGGSGLADAPVAVARNADGRLAVFARSADGALLHSVETTPGGTWSAWGPVGTDVVGSPDAVVNGDGRLEVFARGSDGALWHAAQTTPGGAFGAFESLGGTLAGDPAAVLDGASAVVVFARGTDGALWKLAGTTWTSQGGTFAGDPAAARSLSGVSAFARDDADMLFGQAIAGRPAAVLDGQGKIQLFARGADGTLLQSFEDTPAVWRSLGGSFTGDPAAVRDGHGFVHVFIAGARNEFFSTEQVPFDPAQFRPFTSLGSAAPPPLAIVTPPPVTPDPVVLPGPVFNPKRTFVFDLVFKTRKPTRASTEFRSLNVTGVPAGATVVATCAKGCARKRYTAAHAFGKVPLKTLIAEALPVGTKIVVAVSVPGMVTATRTLTVRKLRAPRVR
jgi:hypothetical protein